MTSNQCPFEAFVSITAALRSKDRKRDNKLNILTGFMARWRQGTEDPYLLMSFLLPQLHPRQYYIKQQSLFKLYCKVLSLSVEDEKRYANFRLFQDTKGGERHQSKTSIVDFLELLNNMLYARCYGDGKGVTCSEIDIKLQELSVCSNEAQKVVVLSYFFQKLSITQQLAVVRLILKRNDISISENKILDLYHPSASQYFQYCSNLEMVVRDLSDPLTTIDIQAFKVFQPFSPQLCKSSDFNNMEILSLPEFWIETKWDGERIQMHYEDGKFFWWSRNIYDYSSTYGTEKLNGSLTPYIILLDHGNDPMRSCVLDGEMLAYNVEKSTFEPFGSLKSASRNDVVHLHPCFIAFDIVYYNGRSLKSTPLRERFNLIQKVFVPNEYMLIQEHTVGKYKDDLVNALQTAMMQGDEGIMIKDPNSVYTPNERTDWFKIKPDYIDSLADDFDLVVIGGYYGRREGRFSAYLCAVYEPDMGGSYPTFCKIGTGFTLEEREAILNYNPSEWILYDANNRPDWFKHPVGKEVPNLIIHPEKSVIVQVRGAQIVPSNSFAAGLTLRFPRYITIRENKSLSDIATLSDVKRIMENPRQRASELIMSSTNNDSPSKKNKGPSRRAKLLPQFQNFGTNLESKSETFKGLEFCVICRPETMHALETLIINYGGKTTLAPLKNTDYIITDYEVDSMPIKLKNIIKSSRYNIVKPLFLLDSIEANTVVELMPRHVLFGTDETNESLAQYRDKYGDSFMDYLDEDALKKVILVKIVI